MRFDDMLATVMAQPAANPAARSVKWRQLVDLLAQQKFIDRAKSASQSDTLEAVLAYLREHRKDVDPAIRKDVAHALSGRRVSPLLVEFFSEDHPSIAIPVIGTVRLSAAEWRDLLPRISVTARALLRHRRDLDPEVAQALASFGSTDFILTGSVDAAPSVNPAVEAGEDQIRDLVARIEAYRQNRTQIPPDVRTDSVPVESFNWETGPDGVIIWVKDAPRGPLIGQTIATISITGDQGVDGQAAGAFEKRTPFQDARFTVAGAGAASGDWRISGVPFFEPRRGSFLGYRGNARRPRVDEVARPDLTEPAGLFGTGIPSEALRQLIHELRTPLNAIVGFSEMIDGQYLGPAGSDYRARSRDIMEKANQLLSAVDDLDTAARLETRRMVLHEASVDTGEVLRKLHVPYARVADQRQAKISISVASDLPAARIEPAAAERMFARMLAATIGLARHSETIAAEITMKMHAGQPMLCLAIDRPRAISGMEESALLDPGYSPEGDWPGAPALGLGFALRLVRNLAEASGGALIVGVSRFFLYIPAMNHEEQASGHVN